MLLHRVSLGIVPSPFCIRHLVQEFNLFSPLLRQVEKRKIQGHRKGNKDFKREERDKERKVLRLPCEGIDLGEARANLGGRFQQQYFKEYILDRFMYTSPLEGKYLGALWKLVDR